MGEKACGKFLAIVTVVLILVFPGHMKAMAGDTSKRKPVPSTEMLLLSEEVPCVPKDFPDVPMEKNYLLKYQVCSYSTGGGCVNIPFTEFFCCTTPNQCWSDILDKIYTACINQVNAGNMDPRVKCWVNQGDTIFGPWDPTTNTFTANKGYTCTTAGVTISNTLKLTAILWSSGHELCVNQGY